MLTVLLHMSHAPNRMFRPAQRERERGSYTPNEVCKCTRSTQDVQSGTDVAYISEVQLLCPHNVLQYWESSQDVVPVTCPNTRNWSVWGSPIVPIAGLVSLMCAKCCGAN